QKLAGDILTNPVHVHVGSHNLTANEDIHQVVKVLNSDAQKWNWLSGRITELVTKGKASFCLSIGS
ncbi:unnamed protein product, partial [Choristocarpus tenellus]